MQCSIFIRTLLLQHNEMNSKLFLKRFFDLFLALILLIILLLPMLIIACVVRITMGKPALFVQQRPGLHEVPFYLYKFRTMKNTKDNNGNPLPDEIRLTAAGRILRRLSLDELPQLFNVLRGDLSFVGPRPLLMEYLPKYSPEQARRHEVKPGITGWAQVNGRNAVSWAEKFKLDVWYVNHQSFSLDIKIIWLTAIKVFKQEGINADQCATMPKFTGSHNDME
jgi:sugar transferase EpsL